MDVQWARSKFLTSIYEEDEFDGGRGIGESERAGGAGSGNHLRGGSAAVSAGGSAAVAPPTAHVKDTHYCVAMHQKFN